MECYKCGKADFAKKKVDFVQLGILLGKFEALVCPVCEETVFEGSVSKKIEAKAKEAKKGQEVIIEPLEKNKIGITVMGSI